MLVPLFLGLCGLLPVEALRDCAGSWCISGPNVAEPDRKRHFGRSYNRSGRANCDGGHGCLMVVCSAFATQPP